MKVFIDKNNYIDIKPDKDKEKVVITFKAKKSEKELLLLTAEFSEEQVDQLIANLVTARAKI